MIQTPSSKLTASLARPANKIEDVMSGCSRRENGRELRTITGSIPAAREPSGYRGRSRLEGDDVDGLSRVTVAVLVSRVTTWKVLSGSKGVRSKIESVRDG